MRGFRLITDEDLIEKHNALLEAEKERQMAYVTEAPEGTPDRIEVLEARLDRILQWCDAYPLDIFPEPDMKKARALLEAGGMTIDAISASAARHVLKGVQEIARGARDERL